MRIPAIESVGGGLVTVTFPIQGEMRDEGYRDVTVLMGPEEMTWKAITRNLRSAGWSRHQAKLIAYDFFQLAQVVAIRPNSVTLGLSAEPVRQSDSVGNIVEATAAVPCA